MLAPILTLTSCLTSGPEAALNTDALCSAGPIIIDPADRLTERTKRAIVTIDEAGAKVCGWLAPIRGK
jgi:hypothetical protein